MKRQRMAQQAKRYPEMVFNNVFHLIDREFLLEAYRQTRKSSAPGMDKVTAKQYAENLEANLQDLHERLRDNRYVAPPVERVWIEKEDGKKRPIGKPGFEDKIVQRAVVMILEAIFEPDFHAFSHGFRKGHSQHQALHELREQCRKLKINWIVDADVSGFFDNLDWGWLRAFIQQRVNDGGILRLIGKWLHAGVLEAGELTHPDKGAPQGAVLTLPTCHILVRKWNQDGGAWAEPTEGQDDVDCRSESTSDSRVVAQIQVVRAIVDPTLWKTLSVSGRVRSEETGIERLADWLKESIEKKAKRTPTPRRAQLHIALDATRLPGLGFDDVAGYFLNRYGPWANVLGFASIWLVGPSTRLTWRLDLRGKC